MKKLGILSFFPAFSPPRSGGELRLFHVAMYLAKHGFDINMVSPTFHDSPREEVEHDEHFHEVRLPKTRIYNKLHGFMDRVAGFPECSSLVCSLAASHHAALKEEADKILANSDIFTQESPFLSPLVRHRPKRRQLFVYNAYNVEGRMAADMYGRSLQGRMATRRIRRLEKNLLQESDVVLACSQEDIDIFHGDFSIPRAKMVLVPNGVDVDAIKPCANNGERQKARKLLNLSNARPACFFLGSYHPPNMEAVDVIIHELAMAVPEADFLVAGKVSEAFQGRQVPENVRLMGMIEEEEKDALFKGCDVALNPMLSGSGTNLKMLEYFSAGLPVLTTPHGARGLGVQNRRHALVCPPDRLATGLCELLGDSTFCKLLGRESRALVEEEFSWKTIGERVADLYTLKTGRRIIILNDYTVHPADQGGRVRVSEVANRLAKNNMGVTLLTLSSEPNGRRIQLGPNMEELNVPRTAMHRRIDALLSHLVGCSVDDASALIFTKWLTPRYHQVFQKEVRHAEAVMLSHPYMETISKKLPKGIKLYFDSHNTEFRLKEAIFSPGRFSNYMVKRVRQAETDAAKRSSATFCVSEENRQDLISLVPELEGKSWVCPNGVDCSRLEVLSIEERRLQRRQVGFGREFVAVFLGSGHPPNREAAELIIKQISREHPRVLFLLVGTVCGWFWNQSMPGNVLLMGKVSTPVKDFLLQTADFALNPMMTGSGTSLKLFDYMSAGLPVLSTEVGARGLEGEAMEGVILLEPGEFSQGLRELLSNRKRCEEIVQKARNIAEKYFDWSVALNAMEEVIVPEPQK
jgi:glycosyltransferase involved in cell wall biosynthesis